MAKRKKDLTPEEIEKIRLGLEDIRREVRALIEMLQARQQRRPQPQ
jgi:hypothetical protein